MALLRLHDFLAARASGTGGVQIFRCTFSLFGEFAHKGIEGVVGRIRLLGRKQIENPPFGQAMEHRLFTAGTTNDAIHTP